MTGIPRDVIGGVFYEDTGDGIIKRRLGPGQIARRTTRLADGHEKQLREDLLAEDGRVRCDCADIAVVEELRSRFSEDEWSRIHLHWFDTPCPAK